MIEATGERISDPLSSFHQVADEICWHDCHIASPSQSPCLDVYFARLPRTLPSYRPRWRETVVMTPQALLISAPDRMLLPAYLESNMYAAACFDFRQKSSRFLMYFRTAVSSAWSNSEVGWAVRIPLLHLQAESEHQTGCHCLPQISYMFQAAYHSPKIHHQDPLDMAVHIDRNMAISWKDSFPSRRLSNMMTTPPQWVLLGSFNVVLLFFSL